MHFLTNVKIAALYISVCIKILRLYISEKTCYTFFSYLKFQRAVLFNNSSLAFKDSPTVSHIHGFDVEKGGEGENLIYITIQ